MNAKKVLSGILLAVSVSMFSACEVTDWEFESSRKDISENTQTPPALVMPPPPEDLPPILDKLDRMTEGELSFPTKHAYDFSVLLRDFESAPEIRGLGHLYLPKNKDIPIPAMVILHGSGGIKPGREHEYAKLFTENGIAGFVVDYYTPRGSTEDTPYLIKTMIATEIDVLVDAYAALRFLSTHPAIDAKRIGVIGFSYGGMATRFALDKRVANILAPFGLRFSAHADFYGPCHQILGSNTTTKAPYLAVFGDQDNSVHPETCETVHAEIENSGSPTQIEIIEGAGHAWENDQPRLESPSPYIRGCEFSFDPKMGDLLIDGKPTVSIDLNTDLSTRMNLRSQIANYVQHCLKHGYIIGKDAETDRRAKEVLLDFLAEHL